MASRANLKALRDQLLLSYSENLIDAEDFMLLYDANIPKGIYLNTLIPGHLMANNVQQQTLDFWKKTPLCSS